MTGQRGLAIAALFGAGLFFAANVLVARMAPGLVPPVALACFRWLTVGSMIVVASRFSLLRHWDIVRREWPMLLFLGTLGIAICGALPYVAGRTTTAANIALIYALSPIPVVLVGPWLLNERLTPVRMLGVVLSVAGALLIVTQGSLATLLGLDFVVGDIFVLVSALSWSVYSVLIKLRPSALPPLDRLAAFAFGGVIALFPFLLWESAAGDPVQLNLVTVGIVLFVALVPGFGAYSCHAYATRVLGASLAALTSYIMPVFSLLLAWPLIGEVPQLHHWLGGGAILLGIWLANRPAT
jgi:drug/metabolite transporter (DMT)-like permease